MQDYWLRVKNDRRRWEDRASFLADDDAQAVAVARAFYPLGPIDLRRDNRRIPSRDGPSA